ncbi:hypothetical protein CQW23_32376 [Capsicum baccatum]|uniref:NB-ARC domain-containing protein n=1 Tax=Capsicum baccatum TaxID=33114 RepID=A0A2G2V4V2_CAPBA|nr:hypothetical protein CQW23_32376 [Capsicum baccatum]
MLSLTVAVEGPRRYKVSSAVLPEDIVNLRDFIQSFVITFQMVLMPKCMSYISYEVHGLDQSLFHQSGDDMLAKLNDHAVPRLLKNIKSFAVSDHQSESSATMTEGQLVELLDALLVNLHYLPKVCAELIFPSMTQYELLQNVFGNLRDFNGLKVNRCIEHKTIEYVLLQFQLMAERVGHFCISLLAYAPEDMKRTKWMKRIIEVSRVSSILVHLLLKLIPVSLEVMYICSTNLKASKSAEVGCFIKKLLEVSPDILREYLIHLKQHMINSISPSTSAQHIHVVIEFLLLILTDVPKDVIHHDKLLFSWNVLEHLPRRVKEDLEHIRSFFGNVEQELHRDHWTRVLDVAYEAEHAINSILARDRGLLQLIFLLPETVGKIKLVKKEIQEKISKNMSIIFANSPNKPVINKSSIASKIIVGFEEETEWIIRKLTSGPAEVDVISIVGMPGLGKTTLAYRVYNEKSVVGHFDVCAWCTVDQESTEKKLLQKIFNQVTGLKERVSDDDIDADVADKLRRQLFGKRYLIVLDDLWDTVTWDELTRPFPTEFQKGSRVILTSRKKEVALHGKCHSHLKPFLLYLASYPKDEDIVISWLKDLWSDEGLVEPTDLKSVEELTEVYVDELISSSLSRKEKSLCETPLFDDTVYDFARYCEICMLVHLRHLRIEMVEKVLPSSFSNLCNLETLEVANGRLNLINASQAFLFSRLRRYFPKIPNLQTLRFIMDCSAAEQIYFPTLDVLNKLERVNANLLCSTGRHVHQFDFHLPSNLEEVELNSLNLISDALSGIGRSLPNLQKLELRGKHPGWKRMEHGTSHLPESQITPFPCSRNYIYDIVQS